MPCVLDAIAEPSGLYEKSGDAVVCSRERWPGAVTKRASFFVSSKEQRIAKPRGDFEQNILHKVKPVKLIFLDMDGPIAPYPYETRNAHAWDENDSLDEEPYARHVNALKRIVDESGGPEVVKIVLSSNWRKSKERTLWLEDQFQRRGIDMIGHTDMVHVNTEVVSRTAISCVLARDIEIYRAVRHNALGHFGFNFDKTKNTVPFMPWRLPTNWKVKAWIAIDDLALDAVPPMTWDWVSRFASFVSVSCDTLGENGWVQPPPGFAVTMRAFTRSLAKRFVKVDMQKGIAGTQGAVVRAIQLLNAPTVTAGSQDRDALEFACMRSSI